MKPPAVKSRIKGDCNDCVCEAMGSDGKRHGGTPTYRAEFPAPEPHQRAEDCAHRRGELQEDCLADIQSGATARGLQPHARVGTHLGLGAARLNENGKVANLMGNLQTRRVGGTMRAGMPVDHRSRGSRGAPHAAEWL